MFDLLIQNGTVLDGSGKEGFAADVAVKDGKIAAIGKNLGDARQVLDATGLTVTPGFIDSHSHSDGQMLTFPAQMEKVEQGITTSLGGQCGSSPGPVVKNGELITLGTLLQKGCATPQGSNLAVFAGHSSIRKAVMGMENRAATAEAKAKTELNLEAYKEAMAGIYTTSVNEATLDEAPMAYKSLKDIIDVIEESVDVIEVMKPIYNFKAN